MKTLEKNDLQGIQLALLKKIDSFCKANDLKYYLFSGSLIGAVRHKGFIPWDDDIDICMVREDYEYFFKYFNEQQNEQIKAICHNNYDNYYLVSGKVIDSRTVLKENVNFDSEIGVYVDVFPLDKLPNDDKSLKKLDRKIKKYRRMLMLKTVTVDKKRASYKNMILRIASFLLAPVPISFILNKINGLAQTYRFIEDCERLGNISVFTYGMNEVFDKTYFESTIKLEFEGSFYSAPVGYDKILSKMYGDYMKLPSIQERVSHHSFEVYWKESED